MIGENEDINEEIYTKYDASDEKDEPHNKFSYKVARVIIKPSRTGHIVKINCGRKSQMYLSRERGTSKSH